MAGILHLQAPLDVALQQIARLRDDPEQRRRSGRRATSSCRPTASGQQAPRSQPRRSGRPPTPTRSCPAKCAAPAAARRSSAPPDKRQCRLAQTISSRNTTSARPATGSARSQSNAAAGKHHVGHAGRAACVAHPGRRHRISHSTAKPSTQTADNRRKGDPTKPDARQPNRRENNCREQAQPQIRPPLSHCNHRTPTLPLRLAGGGRGERASRS